MSSYASENQIPSYHHGSSGGGKPTFELHFQKKAGIAKNTMSAKEQMRAMLDQLMGTQADDKAKPKCSFDHPRVCRLFLLGCCPHDILAGTRVDLGDCRLMHDFALKADFEAAQKEQDYYFDIEAVDILRRFVEDCDRRTEFAKQKLKDTQEELGEEAARKMNMINKLGEEIGTKLALAEQQGASGEIEQSIALMEEVERLKRRKVEFECDFRSTMPASAYQQQKLRVCEVCSAYLGIHDNDRRLADHFGGKLHIGFIKIRTKLGELNAVVQERKSKRDADKGYQKLLAGSNRWKFVNANNDPGETEDARSAANNSRRDRLSRDKYSVSGHDRSTDRDRREESRQDKQSEIGVPKGINGKSVDCERSSKQRAGGRSDYYRGNRSRSKSRQGSDNAGRDRKSRPSRSTGNKSTYATDSSSDRSSSRQRSDVRDTSTPRENKPNRHRRSRSRSAESTDSDGGDMRSRRAPARDSYARKLKEAGASERSRRSGKGRSRRSAARERRGRTSRQRYPSVVDLRSSSRSASRKESGRKRGRSDTTSSSESSVDRRHAADTGSSARRGGRRRKQISSCCSSSGRSSSREAIKRSKNEQSRRCR